MQNTAPTTIPPKPPILEDLLSGSVSPKEVMRSLSATQVGKLCKPTGGLSVKIDHDKQLIHYTVRAAKLKGFEVKVYRDAEQTLKKLGTPRKPTPDDLPEGFGTRLQSMSYEAVARKGLAILSNIKTVRADLREELDNMLAANRLKWMTATAPPKAPAATKTARTKTGKENKSNVAKTVAKKTAKKTVAKKTAKKVAKKAVKKAAKENTRKK